MRAMFRLQRFVLQQLLDHRPKHVEMLAAFLGSFEVTLVLSRRISHAHA